MTEEFQKQCEHSKQIVCGVEMCGTCYEEEMMRSKDRAKKNLVIEEYDIYKHMVVIKKGK